MHACSEACSFWLAHESWQQHLWLLPWSLGVLLGYSIRLLCTESRHCIYSCVRAGAHGSTRCPLESQTKWSCCNRSYFNGGRGGPRLLKWLQWLLTARGTLYLCLTSSLLISYSCKTKYLSSQQSKPRRVPLIVHVGASMYDERMCGLWVFWGDTMMVSKLIFFLFRLLYIPVDKTSYLRYVREY